MYKFRLWCINHRDEINWFTIFLLIIAGVIDIYNENYIVSALSFGIAFANYVFRKYP